MLATALEYPPSLEQAVTAIMIFQIHCKRHVLLSKDESYFAALQS
jgi:hypothetical protein